MALRGWLLDKSAYVRMQFGRARDSELWDQRIERGLVRLSTITRLELGFSARSGDEGREVLFGPPVSLMPVEYLTPSIENRALEVQMLLADRGQHRAPSIPDLLIAATAERVGLTVLSVDKDFEIIAAITGQAVETLELTAE
ncbi:MAG: PIN domain nuclease [Propionibacteriaceae bacterium]|nr:PIN domain nuclease [Propionibacteriaceae bacterium]